MGIEDEVSAELRARPYCGEVNPTYSVRERALFKVLDNKFKDIERQFEIIAHKNREHVK